MIKLPGLIDVHAHLREPGQTHKEDWDSGTRAALAGGITMLLAMPNTSPPVVDVSSLMAALQAAASKAHCDYAQFLGAGPRVEADAGRRMPVAGLKMYLDQTFGPLRLDSMELWQAHFQAWPSDLPIVVHADGRSLGAAILMADLYDRHLHAAHVATREAILLVRAAKEKGLRVTCEVCPHHLLPPPSAGENQPESPAGRLEVRPPLPGPEDVAALWDNLEVIDCFASDHAPHTLAEKDGQDPPPGFPGLESMLPLLLTAVDQGRLTLEDLVRRLHDNPRRIFNLPEQSDTWVEIDETSGYELHAAGMQSRCGWTPYEGVRVHGRVARVVLRGREAYRDGRVLVEPGFGRNVRQLLAADPDA